MKGSFFSETKFCFLLVLILQQCGNTKLENEKMWTYYFNANTSIGNNLLTQASSQWTLSGYLFIVSFEKHKIMKLQNLMTSSYNGPKDQLPEVQEFQISNYTNILTEAFVAHYDQNHKNLESVHFLTDEPIWSRNIKKAIASVYQLNYQFNPNSNDLEDIIIENNQTSIEENIFGRCELKYKINNSDNTLNIVKRIDVSKCKLTNTTRKLWKNKNHGQFSSETIRNYVYNKVENITNYSTVPFDKIVSITTMQYSKMRTKKFGQTITQTIKLIREDSKQIDKNFDISSHNLIKTPVYEFERSEIKSNLKGTPLIDNWILQKVLEQNRTEYYSERTFNMFENLYATVSAMDWETLNDYLTDRFHSKSQMLNIYASLLPFIGSDSSVKCIKELMSNEHFSDNRAISMIATFPFYVKNINYKILMDMEDYLSPNNSLNKLIYHTYILSFSNLVAKFESSIDKLEPQQELVDIVNRYVDHYYTNFHAINDSNTRRHYLLGLGNMGPRAIDYLILIVKNETETRHIRSLATYTMKPLIVDKKDMAFRIFWPIVKSSCEPYELRIAALTLLLESYLDSAQFYSIFMYMKKITDNPVELHLYSYFYTRLNCDKFWKQINHLADIFLADLQPPLATKGLMTGRYYAQYSDVDENFRTSLDTHIVANPISNFPNVVRVTFSDYINQNDRLNAFALYVKAEGISRLLKPKNNFNMPIKELYNILKKYELEATPQEFYFEVIVYYNDKAVFSWGSSTYDSEFLYLLDDLVAYFIQTDTMKFEYLDQTEFVSDLGTTVISELKNENLYSARFHTYNTLFLSKGNKTGHYVSGKFKYMAVEKTDLKSLNPITNITHGVSSIYSLQRLLKFKVEHNLMDDLMLRWSDINNILEHVVDFKDAVYIYADDNTNIKKYCTNCSLLYFPTAPMDVQVVDLLLFKMKTVNCTASEAPSSDVYYKSRIVNSGSSLLTPLISLLYARDYFHNVAPYDTCSGMFYLAANKKAPKEYSLYVKSLIYVENESNNVSFNWNISMNLYQHNLLNKQLVNEWYIQFVKEENYDKDTIKIIVDDKQKLLHMVIDSWFVTHHQLPAYDMFSLSAPPPMSGNTDIYVYKNDTLAYKLRIKSFFEVSEANKEVIKSCEKYMKCKAESIDTMKHNAPTKNCFDVSNEISKYDDYSVDVELYQTSNILQEIAAEQIIQLLSTYNNVSSTSTTNFHIKYNALNGLLELYSEKQQIKKVLVPKLYRHKLQAKNKVIHNIMHNTYGLNSVCIITPYNVKTFTDSNIPYESMFTKSMVSLILCSNNTRIGLVTTVEEHQIGFRFWYDDEIFEINISKNLTVNGNRVTQDQENNLYSLKFYENSFVIITKKVELYYNQDYVSVNIKSMLIPDMCGTCSSDEVIASNILESLYLSDY